MGVCWRASLRTKEISIKRASPADIKTIPNMPCTYIGEGQTKNRNQPVTHFGADHHSLLMSGHCPASHDDDDRGDDASLALARDKYAQSAASPP
jgi:hypothetical protein